MGVTKQANQHDYTRSYRRPTITGPHTGYNRYGRPDHTYYRCEACGWDTCDATTQTEGYPNCGAGGPR